MVMITIAQIVCAVCSVASLGYSMKKDHSKFDKIVYSVGSIVYIVLLVAFQGVK